MSRVMTKAGMARVAAIVGAVALTGPARAEDILETLGVTTSIAAPKPFIVQSRGAAHDKDFMAVGVRPKDRETKPMTAAQVKARQADLEAALVRQQARASAPVPATPPQKK